MLRSNPETKKIKYGNKADIWSLGVCLYQMISFQLPFNDEFDVLDVNINYTNLSGDNPLIPLVQQMLNKDVAGRPSAIHMFESIQQLSLSCKYVSDIHFKKIQFKF